MCNCYLSSWKNLRMWHPAGEHTSPLTTFTMWMTHSWTGFMDQKMWMTFLTTSTTFFCTSNLPLRLSQTGTSHSWKLTHMEDKTAPCGTMCTESPHPSTYFWILSYITILLISILCYPPWYIKLQPSVTKKVIQKNWDSSEFIQTEQLQWEADFSALNPPHTEHTPRQDLWDPDILL
jgi:hypothetical protein